MRRIVWIISLIVGFRFGVCLRCTQFVDTLLGPFNTLLIPFQLFFLKFREPTLNAR